MNPSPFIRSIHDPDLNEAFRTVVDRARVHAGTDNDHPDPIALKTEYIVLQERPTTHFAARSLASRHIEANDARFGPNGPAGAVPFGRPTVLASRHLNLDLPHAALAKADGDERNTVIEHACLAPEEHIDDLRRSHGKGGEDGYTSYELTIEQHAPPEEIEGWVFFSTPPSTDETEETA